MVDVYLAPDEEVLTFDAAETGIRNLMQNQTNIGFRSRRQASLLSDMLVLDPHRAGRNGLARGSPWIDIRRNLLGGGAVDNPCGDTVDIGSTTDHLDRIQEILREKVGDDVRSRRLAAIACPFSLPEIVEGRVHDQMYRESDVDAFFTNECGDPQTVRVLSRGHQNVSRIPGDSVHQRGVVFDMAKTTGGSDVFDIDQYCAHIAALKQGETVTVMSDTTLTQTAQNLGRIIKITPDEIHIQIEGTELIVKVGRDFESIAQSETFAYGASWKGAAFCRTRVGAGEHGLVFIPWSTNITGQSFARLVQPSAVHSAIARSRSDVKQERDTSSCFELLFGTDDVALTVPETDIIRDVIHQSLARSDARSPTPSVLLPSLEVSANGVLGGHQAFIAVLLDQGTEPNVMKGGKARRRRGEEKHQRVQVDLVTACLWTPRTALSGLVAGCMDVSKGDVVGSMDQGHVQKLADYVDTSVLSLSVLVAEARARRDFQRRAEATELSDQSKHLLGMIASGSSRLRDEHTRRPPKAASSPFDVYRYLDILRWTNESHTSQRLYINYKGNEQSAFEADLAATRVQFEDRGFYKTWEPLDKDKDEGAESVDSGPANRALFTVPIMLELMIDACGIVGLHTDEIASIVRNTLQYRPIEETAKKIRRRIDMVKRARNRPEFREQNLKGRAALEKRLVDRVKIDARRDHVISVLDMLGALLCILVRLSAGRIHHATGVLVKKRAGRQTKGDTTLHVIAAGVLQIVLAILPSDVEQILPPRITAIQASIREVEDDKRVNGIELVIEDDRHDAIVKPRATRDTPWPDFRPMMINLSDKTRANLSQGLKDVAHMQLPFFEADALIFKANRRLDRNNVCCLYALPSPRSTQSHSETESKKNKLVRMNVRTRDILTVLEGTTTTDQILPVEGSVYTGDEQEVVTALPGVRLIMSQVPASWMEDAVSGFLDLNKAFSNDSALSGIAGGSGSKASWSALATQNTARFLEMSARGDPLPQDQIDIIRNGLLIPTLLDGKAIQDQQFRAKLFLKSIVIPLFGRLANNIRSSDADHDADRLNAIMNAHEPRREATLLRSLLSELGDIQASDNLALAQGPLMHIASLRASVHLLMGVALSALWRLLTDAGGGPLGSTIVKPIVSISLNRLAMSMRFARADESVTRLIQDQREDNKLRKIDIFKRLMPDDIEAIKALRLIFKDKDVLDWEQIEHDYATDTESATLLDKQNRDDMKDQALEIAALGAYPDEDRTVDDADQEMMDYT